MNRQNINKESGNTMLIVVIVVLAIMTIVFGGLAIWSYVNYQNAYNDVEGQKEVAAAQARQEQAEKSLQEFTERDKEPNARFVGPDDYGRLEFNYPKTWSVHEATDISRGGTYEAYLNPGVVPPIGRDQQFALRVTIESKDYDAVVAGYANLVRKGDLRSGVTTASGNQGTRFDGNFSNNIRGSAVVYKIRDKTVTLRTDAETFMTDFDRIIQTITYND